MLKWIHENPEWVAIFISTFLVHLVEHFIASSKKINANSLIGVLINIFNRRKP